MLDARTRWLIEKQTPSADDLAKDIKVSPVVAQLLWNRGCSHPEEALAFLHTNENALHAPELLSDLPQAVERIQAAITREEKIVVFGDYDVDGVSSTTLMMETLVELGADCDWYVPNRFTEGYGPNIPAVQSLSNQGCTLLITVDTGIAAPESVARANELGMDVIVTDHHEVPPTLPEAYAIINPKKKDCHYPFKELAGVGVVFKLSQALLGRLPDAGFDLAALGTISDLVPLIDENRYLAKKGVETLSRMERPGVRALRDVAGLNGPPFSAQDVGFGFGPRLNAAGRMQSADPAVRLLMCEDFEAARVLAEEIEALNRERQSTVKEMTAAALTQIGSGPTPTAIVVAGKGWNSGVIGIVASRLVEKFYRPTIVIAVDDEGRAKGSARSIHGFDMYEVLRGTSHLFSHFGGHQMAAGLSIDEVDIPQLRTYLNESAKQLLHEDDFVPITNIELELEVADISLELIREIDQLAPFGMGNQKPFVCIRDASIQMKKKIGAAADHLKLMLKQGHDQLDCIGFRLGELDDWIQEDSPLTLVGELEVNEWQGKQKPQLIVKDACVTSRQIFDYRGRKDVQPLLKHGGKMSVVVFRESGIGKAERLGFQKEQVYVFGGGGLLSEETDVFLLDLPLRLQDFEHFFKQEGWKIRSIYAGFLHEQSVFFSPKPDREQFKWYYAFLKKYAPIDIATQGKVVARHKGWTEETVSWMTKVFLELEFVTMKEGKIEINNQPVRKDLKDSPSFRAQEQQRFIEQSLLYATSKELRTYMTACIQQPKTDQKITTPVVLEEQ